jgi:hypothetical protein
VSITRLGPMSILDLNNWHVNIVNKTFTFFSVVISLACKYYQPRFHA